ncbi:DUF4238 domain-containing protein [Bacteroidota bacterium]
MTAYKKQHWLPACYMKFFSKSGKPQGRNSEIYYSDAIESKVDRVKNLSYDDFHYSEDDPEAAETSFHAMENDYPNIVEKLLRGEVLNRKEYYGLLLTMIDFHARNPSYLNLTEKENYKAFEIVSQGLMNEVFKDCDSNGNDFKKMLNFMQNNWELQPVCSPKEELFSSDHPSLLFSINDKLAFIFLPITPHYGLVAVDKREIEIISDEISEEDNGILNSIQAQVCIKYVYSNIELSEFIGEEKPLTKTLKKEIPSGYVTTDVWKPEYIDYPGKIPSEFSFLKIR